MSQEEIFVSISFVVMVLLWFFREPGFMPGWAEIFPVPEYISDGVPSLLVGTILFITPAAKTGLFPNIFCGKGTKLSDGPSPSIMTWRRFEEKMPWGVMLLIGGGYAMAMVSDSSGFSSWFASGLENAMKDLNPPAIAFICTIFACLFTQVFSNTGTTALFTPLIQGSKY